MQPHEETEAIITLRDRNSRGRTGLGWLDSHHTFSFGGYQDPNHRGFRSLRVINDDRVAPGGGFSTHSHRNMEIISYVLSGALEHISSERRLAGFQLIGDQHGTDGAVTIHQDVRIYVAELTAGQGIVQDLPDGRHAWLQIARGTVTLDENTLGEGDGAAISDESSTRLETDIGAEVLLFDLA